jgi:prolipoprotein diacylglyceryltransferase
MDKVMMIYGGEYYYWKPVILAIAAAAAAILAIGLRVWRGEKLLPLMAALPFGTVLSVLFARLIHWYCRWESYESLRAALTDLRGGGYSLIGVFVGMLLAFLIVRLLRLTRDLPSLLDCAAPAAALGIALGRLGDLFTASDRGKVLVEDAAMQHLPFASAVVNSTSGATEWRIATFAIQSIWCAILCLVFLVAAMDHRPRPLKHPRWGRGNVFALFMVLYASGQIVLDSTRYDALFLRSNGFVSLEQIICGCVIAAVLVLYSVRSIKVRRFRFWHPLLWLLALACLGVSGYMEYYVQRHGDAWRFAYALMSAGLLVVFGVVFALFRTGMVREETGAGAPDVPAAAEAPAAESEEISEEI